MNYWNVKHVLQGCTVTLQPPATIDVKELKYRTNNVS